MAFELFSLVGKIVLDGADRILVELNNTESALNKTAQRVGALQSSLNNVSQGLTTAGVGIAAFGAVVVAGLGMAASRAIEFESAFAGVRKTVSASEAELAVLRERFLSLSREIPVSASELAKIGEIAGQLGVKTENIEGFTRTIAALGVASNLSGEEGATMIARFANVAQIPQTEYENIGSAIVDLGNNSATTESEIAQMALRLASSGKTAGISGPEILGFAASLSSVGIEADAGGTAMSKLLIAVAQAARSGGDELEQFAKVAGKTGEEFRKSFEDNAAGAVVSFIQGIRRMSDAGEDVFGTLEAMELQEVRLRNAILASANASDIMEASILRAKHAYQENIALQKEAEERYKTTDSVLTILSNTFDVLAVNLGDTLKPTIIAVATAVTDATIAFTDWSKENPILTETVVQLVGILGVGAVGGGGLLLIIGQLTSAVSSLLPLLTGGAGLKAAFALVGIEVASTTAAVKLLAGALGTAGIVGALAVAGVAWINFGRAAEEARTKNLDAKEQIEDLAKFLRTELRLSFEETQQKFDKVTGKFESFAEYSKRIQQLFDDFTNVEAITGDLINSLDGAAESTGGFTEAQEEARKAAADKLEKVKELARELKENYGATVERQAGQTLKDWETSIRSTTSAIEAQEAAVKKAAEEANRYEQVVERQVVSQDELARIREDDALALKFLGLMIPEVAAKQGDAAHSVRMAHEELSESLEDETKNIWFPLSDAMSDAAKRAIELGMRLDPAQLVPKSNELERTIKQISTIITDFGKSLTTSLFDIWGSGRGDFNQGLEDQASALQESLDEQSRSLEEHLEEQDRSLAESLADRAREWADFGANVAEKMADLRSDHASELEEMTRDFKESIQDREQAFNDFVESSREKFEDFRESLLEREASAIESLEKRVKDRAQSLADSEEDSQTKIERLRREEQDKIADATENYNDELRKRGRDFSEYEQDILQQIRNLDRSDRVQASQAEARLRNSLDQRRRDFHNWVEDTRIELERKQAQDKRDADQAVADEREALERKREEYERFVADIAEQQAAIRAETQQRLRDEEEDLNASLLARREELEQFKLDAEADYNARVEAARQKLAEEEADLQASLNRQREEYEQFKIDAIADYEEAKQAAIQKFEEQKNEILAKMRELESQHRTIWGDIKQAGIDALLGEQGIAGAITRFVTEYLGNKLFKKLGELVDVILPGVSKALGGVFGGIFGGGGAAAGTTLGGSIGNTVGGITGATGSGAGAGAAVGGGLTSTLGLAFGAVSAGASIFSLFQNARQETTLNAIEENTRFTALFLGARTDQGILGQLFRIGHALDGGTANTLVGAVESLRNVTFDNVYGQLLKVYDSLEGGQIVKVLETIREALLNGIAVNVDVSAAGVSAGGTLGGGVTTPTSSVSVPARAPTPARGRGLPGNGQGGLAITTEDTAFTAFESSLLDLYKSNPLAFQGLNTNPFASQVLGGVVINVDNMTVRSEQDVRRIAQELWTLQQQRSRASVLG